MFAYLLGIIYGISLPIQAGINEKLGDKVKSTYISTAISCATSLLVALILDMFLVDNFNIPFAEIAKYPFWIWCAGLCGMSICTLNIICLPRIGGAMLVIISAFGQIITGLFIDTFGLFYATRIDMSLSRLLGAVLFAFGVVLAARTPNVSISSVERPPFKYIAACLIAGALCAVQFAIMGTMTEVSGSEWYATTIACTVSTIGSLLVIAILYIVRGRSAVFYDTPDIPFRWYMAIGGAMGMGMAVVASYISPIIGTGMSSITNLIGFMLGGLFVDAIGFLGISKKPITWRKIIGITAMIGGSAIISLL